MYRYVKVNNKYMKNYDRNKEFSYLRYWNVNDLYGWSMSQMLPIDGFKWAEFNEDFIKAIMKKVIKDIFLRLKFNI